MARSCTPRHSLVCFAFSATLPLLRSIYLGRSCQLKKPSQGALAIDMVVGLSCQQLLEMMYTTIDANGMGSASGTTCGGKARDYFSLSSSLA